jgi:hypothetical protein
MKNSGEKARVVSRDLGVEDDFSVGPSVSHIGKRGLGRSANRADRSRAYFLEVDGLIGYTRSGGAGLELSRQSTGAVFDAFAM